jgi:hypothetical protein
MDLLLRLLLVSACMAYLWHRLHRDVSWEYIAIAALVTIVSSLLILFLYALQP